MSDGTPDIPDDQIDDFDPDEETGIDSIMEDLRAANDLYAKIYDSAKEAAKNAPSGGLPPTIERRLATLLEECIEEMVQDAVQSPNPPGGTFWVVVHDWSVDESDGDYTMSIDAYWTINTDLLADSATIRQFDAEAVKARR